MQPPFLTLKSIHIPTTPPIVSYFCFDNSLPVSK